MSTGNYSHLTRISAALHNRLDREGGEAGAGVAERHSVATTRRGVEVEETESPHYLRHS